jgi:hypothetical protein
MCVNIGHGDERVIKAIHDQASVLAYANPFMATEARARLGAKLAEITPGDIDVFFFTNGGAEANENAIKLARMATGRHKILARYRSYHGATAGSITLTGDPRRWAAEPGHPGVVHVLDPVSRDRARLGHGGGIARDARRSDPARRTADDRGVHPRDRHRHQRHPRAADGYMQGVRELCTKHGILMICDEVMAGFGRTGEWFAVDHWKVVPDIITMAKGLTAAYVQLGAVGMRRELADKFNDKVFYGGLTYNSHPLACAAALATIKVYEDDKLLDNAKKMGAVMTQLMAISRASIRRSARRGRSVSSASSSWCATGEESAARAVQRHVGRNGGARQVLPAGRALHLRALEHVLHQPAAVHHRSAAARSVRDHRPRPRDHRSGCRVSPIDFAVVAYCLVGVGLMAQGIRYLVASQFMHYHADVVKERWNQLSAAEQRLVLGLLRGFGAGMFCLGLAIVFIAIEPLRRGAMLVHWFMAFISITYTGMLVRCHQQGLAAGRRADLVTIVMCALCVFASAASIYTALAG